MNKKEIQEKIEQFIAGRYNNSWVRVIVHDTHVNIEFDGEARLSLLNELEHEFNLTNAFVDSPNTGNGFTIDYDFKKVK